MIEYGSAAAAFGTRKSGIVLLEFYRLADLTFEAALKATLPILPCIPFNIHPTSPDALYCPGLVDVVQRVRGGPRVASRKLVTAAGRWGANQAYCALGTPWPDLVFIDVISPRINVPPPPPPSCIP